MVAFLKSVKLRAMQHLAVAWGIAAELHGCTLQLRRDQMSPAAVLVRQHTRLSAVNLPTLSVGQDMDKPEGFGEMEL